MFIDILKKLKEYSNDSTTKYLIGTLIDAQHINAKLQVITSSVIATQSGADIDELNRSIEQYQSTLSTPDTSVTPYKYLSNLASKATYLSTCLNIAYALTSYKHELLNETAIYAGSLATDLSTIASNMDNPIYNAASATLHGFSRELNALDQKIKATNNTIAKTSEIIGTILSALPFLATFFPFLS
ncbi:hypothetical protein [Desulfovibrio sp. DV]|uniref:hypothetical protein n=1 Tax=Desulfovibrio sp. DV TaxID=1844708 RepID=UPI00094B8728|nr:hypothetical protein [Desulfovibrio sp. DV]